MVHLRELVDRVLMRCKSENMVDIRKYPMNELCVRCDWNWGNHIGLQCPDDSGNTFLSQREKIMAEIEHNEKEIK